MPAKDDKDTEAVVGCLVALVDLGLCVGGLFIWPWVVLLYWGWFIPPVFPDAPLLTYWTALGLRLVACVIVPVRGRGQKNKTFEEKLDAMIATLAGVTVVPAFSLALGYAVHLLATR